MSPYKLRLGFFSVGLEAYWAQFDGLKERLLSFNERISEFLSRDGVSVVNLGMVSTPEQGVAAGHRLREADVDLIFLHVATYALSATVLLALRRVKVPVVVLNLAPGAAIDYAAFSRLKDRGAMTGEWLAWCQACSVPEIANVFERCHIPFLQVTGMMQHDPLAMNEIADWMAAARTAHIMEHNRLGLMGHYYGGMLDIYSDLTQHCAAFGGHMEMIEVDELAALRRHVAESETQSRVKQFYDLFDVQPDCPEQELLR
ncbi:MAG TPA: arabinose isomerase, partial [Bryobacteraceae bacterium]|nr:arabinose isomerase [Bryobacteraceae bacterium]